MTATLPPNVATYAAVPSGLMVTPMGFEPTVTVVITVLVPASITDTVPALKFVTYARVPLLLNVIPSAPSPTGIVATTVVPATTETVSSSKFVT